MGNILTEHEVDTLILQLAKGQRTFTEADGQMIMDWARTSRLNNILLELALRQDVIFSISDGVIQFKLPVALDSQRRGK